MSSLNTACSAVVDGSPPTCHFTSFLRGARSRRNSGETQQLDHTQGLSQSSEVTIDREEWARQSPLSKLQTRPLPTKRIRVQLKDCTQMPLTH